MPSILTKAIQDAMENYIKWLQTQNWNLIPPPEEWEKERIEKQKELADLAYRELDMRAVVIENSSLFQVACDSSVFGKADFSACDVMAEVVKSHIREMLTRFDAKLKTTLLENPYIIKQNIKYFAESL